MPLLLLLILIMTIFLIELLVDMKYFYDISQNRLRNQNIVSSKDELQHKNHRKLS